MAAPTTDLSTLSSSEQIFSANYTLPQIRAIHRSLHAEIEDKAARLRTQVGSSYRDLLGTADTIVQMRGHNDAVQDLLGSLGWRCGRDVIAGKTGGLARFGAARAAESGGVAEAARRKLLDGCFLAVGRILKGKGHGQGQGQGQGQDRMEALGERLVLAAKVWLLSRLLVQNFRADVEKEAANDRKTLDSLRRRLRRVLEKMLARVSEDANRNDILKMLCAHSLVNSSGARDGLRYLLEVRSKAMAMALEGGEEGGERAMATKGDDILLAFRLYTRTLLDAQALVPAKLSLALHALKEDPLLRDNSLQQLEVLRLDVCERWCSEEIRYFTPYIRHDDLDSAQAKEMVASWAAKARETLLDSFVKTLAEMTDFKTILELRTSILQLWIRESAKVRGLDPLEMQSSLRQVINARMLAVLETRVSGLELVGAQIRFTLEHWQTGTTGKVARLWDEDGYDEALSRGAAPFIREVASRFFGRGEAVSKAVECYAAWFHVIGVVEEVVETLRKQRWDNDYEEIEDEETIEARQQQLSKEDPNMLQDKLNTALDQVFRRLEDEIKTRWEEQLEEGARKGGDEGDNTKSGQIAMYLLRVIRDIRSQLPKRESTRGFGLGVITSLHRTMTACVSGPVVSSFTASGRLSGQILGGRVLWEGDPAVPNQPSSQAFQFMRDLAAGMADAGVDLWTAGAVRALKGHVVVELCSAWERELAEVAKMGTSEQEAAEAKEEKEDADDGNGDGEGKKSQEETRDGNVEVEGQEKGHEAQDESQDESQDTGEEQAPKVEEGDEEAKEQEDKEKEKDMLIQWLFDTAFLRCSIGGGNAEAASGLGSLEDALFEKTGLQESSRQRISKSARVFWERTSLLFGVLAP